MFRKLLVFFEKLAGRTMLWAGVEVGREGRPMWQLKVMAGIERDSADTDRNAKRKLPPKP